jgi:hypothetical protein
VILASRESLRTRTLAAARLGLDRGSVGSTIEEYLPSRPQRSPKNPAEVGQNYGGPSDPPRPSDVKEAGSGSDHGSVCGATFDSPAAWLGPTKSEHHPEDPAVGLDLNPVAHSPGLLGRLGGLRFATASALTARNVSRPERRGAALRRPSTRPAGSTGPDREGTCG